jgi:alpha-beta hydrolase superfamily lysophospholipase
MCAAPHRRYGIHVHDHPKMPRPLYLPADPDPVFALFHEATAPQLDTAVLLCPPFGWEDMCSYRGRREWALQLAGHGHPTLRIDLPGSGDSGGSPRDPARVEAWTGTIALASRWLLAREGISRVAAVGIGLGGMLALRATELGAPIEELALWAVPSRGRRLVREMRAFSQMEDSQLDGAIVGAESPAGSPDRSTALEDGALAVAGYLLSAETVAALEALQLGADSTAASPSRVLLLDRDGRAVDEALRAALGERGAEVSVAGGEGYARMMMAEPQDAVPASEVFDEVGRWLAQSAEPASPNSPSPGSNGAVADAAQTELTVAGVRLRETPLSFGHDFGDPFGVLTEPLEGKTAGLCVVWLNAGPQRRTGPNRMWVELARRWAAQGVASLRLDLAGIGDAGGDAGPLVDARSFFVHDYLEQVERALDTLQARGLPARFLLGGLCSGGYWAFQTTILDRRAHAALMLNPGVLVYDNGLGHAIRSTRTIWRDAFKRSTWKRVVRGQITYAAHLRTLRVLLSQLPLRAWSSLATRLGHRGAGSDAQQIEAAFELLDAKGARASMIFAGEEHVHVDLERHGQLARMERWPSITVEHIAAPLNLHTLRPLWLQQTVHEMLDETLRSELARLGETASSRPA